ncbi:replication-relaxation family protein [Amycolatopsis sacchari]|uniref:replication-relaxation family protein n=1 Tax=Amycolatopsis sacchari TaxID=115433 RepID=UPI003D759656
MWFRLVDRDRRLLALLAEHKVLTTNQIAAIEFLSVRRAQDRLRHLRELGVVFAFRESYLRGGTSQTRYALGYLGARLIAAQRAERPPAPKAYTESLERLALWPKLEHQLGVNDFFCTLAAHRNRARLREAGRDGEVDGLTQWWSERRCTEFFWKYQGGGRETRLRPDGYGCWEERGRTVRFFLEHDTGTESLTKVTGKLDDYAAFPTDAFGVLLFSVHSTRREIALRTALRRALGGSEPGFVIATAARDDSTFGHADGPAGPIWGLWTPQGGDTVPRRYRLAELPQRGPSVEHSASNTDQPFNEAAFDPNDREMSRRIDTPQPDPADPAGYVDDDDDLDDVTLYDDADDDDVYRAPTAPARPDARQPRRTRWAA